MGCTVCPIRVIPTGFPRQQALGQGILSTLRTSSRTDSRHQWGYSPMPEILFSLEETVDRFAIGSLSFLHPTKSGSEQRTIRKSEHDTAP